MSINQPKNLESDFNNLSINPEWKKTLAHNYGCTFCRVSKKEYSFKNILVTSNCTCKISKKPKYKSYIVRPAKLNLPITNKKKVKKSILKPPTLHFSNEKNVICETSTSKRAILQQNTNVISDLRSQVFIKNETDSHDSFKSLLRSSDTDVSKAFDSLSFKELRPQVEPHSPTDGTKGSKRENNSSSSCSVQARMESSLYADCDDTSIEELASYFDLFVHIPKKMSSMAEMMYI